MIAIAPLSVHLPGVPFAIMAGTGAGVLSLLSWELFRDSPIEPVMAVLSVIMPLAAIYHALLVVFGPELPALELLRGVLYLAFLVGFWLMVRTHLSLGGSVGDYRRSPLVVVSGMIAFVTIGLASELLVLPFVHWAHGFATLLVVGGLYRSVCPDRRTTEWAERLLYEPSLVREPPEWMTPLDDSILELCCSSGLVLTPAIIGFNIEYSRAEVNRRMSKLERHGLIERIERGKYRITSSGKRYVRG